MSDLPPPAPVDLVATGIGPIAVRRTPTRGDGPHEPAILVHGLAGNAMNWVDLAAALADRLDCVSMDLPGHGVSPPPADGDYSIAAHTRAVLALAKAVFGDQEVHLFGHSMGGAICVQVAARHPEMVRTLCLVSPALPDRRPQAINLRLPVMVLPGIGKVVYGHYTGAGVDKRLQATFEQCFADPSTMAPQRRAEAEEEARRRDTLPYLRDVFLGSAQGLIVTYLDRGPQRPWKLAEQVHAPTLLVYGLKDRLVDTAAAHRAAETFPNAHVKIIPDSGHVAMQEHPELVDQWWREYLG